MKPCTLPLNDSSTWPLRMKSWEVSHVWRVSRATFYARLKAGRFPQSDSDGMWSRETVVRYVTGGIQKFDERHEREQRRRRA